LDSGIAWLDLMVKHFNYKAEKIRKGRVNKNGNWKRNWRLATGLQAK